MAKMILGGVLRILIISVLLSWLSTANADLYVLDGGTSSTCTSWSDACDQVTTAEARVTRGETIWIGEGTYTGVIFDVTVSGSTYIYVKKATVSAHGMEDGWAATMVDGQAIFSDLIEFRTGYWQVSGAYRDENNWFDGDSYGFKIIGHDVGAWNDDVTVFVQSSYYPSNLILSYIFSAGTSAVAADSGPLFYTLYATTGCQVDHCYFWRGRVHIYLTRNVGTVIEYNAFDSNSSEGADHGESIQSNDGADNVIVRHNQFKTCKGTGVVVINTSDGWEIYGNLFQDFDVGGNGVIAVTSEEDSNNVKIYNNTFVDGNNCVFDGMNLSTGWDSKNNIFYNCTYLAPRFGGSIHTHAYNAFSADISDEVTDQTNISSAIFTDYDNNDFTLASATSAGETLASPYNIDMLGNTRGSDGAWDRGAYEYQPPPQGRFTPANFNTGRITAVPGNGGGGLGCTPY